MLNAAARVVYDELPGPVGTLKQGMWIVWVLHLLTLVLLLVGTVGLVGPRARSASTVIDTVIVVSSAGLLGAVLIAIPCAGKPGIGAVWAGARIGYVIRDVLLLALAAYIWLTARRSASSLLFQAGLLGLVAYDVLFRVGRIRGAVPIAGP